MANNGEIIAPVADARLIAVAAVTVVITLLIPYSFIVLLLPGTAMMPVKLSSFAVVNYELALMMLLEFDSLHVMDVALTLVVLLPSAVSPIVVLRDCRCDPAAAIEMPAAASNVSVEVIIPPMV